MGEPGGLPSMGSHRVGHDWSNLAAAAAAKFLISPSYLNEIFAGYSNLGFRFFSFITLSMSCHSLLAGNERSAVILMGISLCVICCFSLAAFKICFLCLIFINLINMCLGYFTLGLSCLGLSGFLGLGWLFPSPFQGSFQLLSQVFSHGLSFCLLLLGLLWFKCWGI